MSLHVGMLARSWLGGLDRDCVRFTRIRPSVSFVFSCWNSDVLIVGLVGTSLFLWMGVQWLSSGDLFGMANVTRRLAGTLAPPFGLSVWPFRLALLLGLTVWPRGQLWCGPGLASPGHGVVEEGLDQQTS